MPPPDSFPAMLLSLQSRGLIDERRRVTEAGYAWTEAQMKAWREKVRNG